MKMNVELEIDWLNEDMTLNEEMQNQVTNAIINKIYTKLEKDLSIKISENIEKTFDKKIIETYEQFLNKGFDIYDNYGEVKQKGVTVIGLLKEKLDGFMVDKIDGNGNVVSKCNGGLNAKYRYEKILDDIGTRKVNDFLKGLSHKVVEGIKEDINKEAEQRISKAILSDYKLKDLIK